MANNKKPVKSGKTQVDVSNKIKEDSSTTIKTNMKTNTTPNINRSYENLNSQYYESQEMVSSKSTRALSSEVLVDGTPFLQLDPVINDFNENRIDINSRDSAVKRAVAFSKAPKIKLRTVPNSKLDLLVNQSIDPVGWARNKANAAQLSGVDIREAVLPDAANFLLSLNVSGHLPLVSQNFCKVSHWTRDENTGMQAHHIAKNDRSLAYLDVNYQNPHQYDGDFNTIQARREAINRPNTGRNINIRVTQSQLNFNHTNINRVDSDAFALDVDTNNFLVDYNILKENVKNSLKVMSLPAVIASDSFLYGKIISDIDAVTLLYILFDSWQSNFDWLSVLDKKLGIMDDTIRVAFLGMNNTVKRAAWDQLTNIARIFDYIPVNKRVVDSWLALKNASLLGHQDISTDQSMLLIPHFQILGNFFNSQNSTNGDQGNVESFNLSSGIGNPAVNIPIYNLLNRLLGNVFEYYFSANYQMRNNSQFNTPYGQVYPHSHGLQHTRVHERVCVSGVRMTASSLNILMTLINTKHFSNTVNDIVVEYSDFYNLLKSNGVYAGTGFEFLTPPVPNFFEYKSPTFTDNSLHKQYLMDFNPRYINNDLMPIIQVDNFDENQIFSNIQHSCVFDMYSSSMYIQKLIKGFLISNLGTNANNKNPEGQFENNIAADLESVFLTSSIVIPFNDTITHLFSMNTLPFCTAPHIQFTHNVNQYLAMPAMLFEFVKYSQNAQLRLEINASHNIRHIGAASPDWNYYLTSQSLAAFAHPMHPSSILKFFGSLGVPTPSAALWSNDMTSQFNFDDDYSFENPASVQYRALWTTRSFGAKSLTPNAFKGGEIIHPDSVSIIPQNDDIKEESIA